MALKVGPRNVLKVLLKSKPGGKIRIEIIQQVEECGLRRVSVASDGTQGNDWSYNPSISGDGRFVAFGSFASNLVSGDTNGQYYVFVHDRQTGVTELVSVASDGTYSVRNQVEPFADVVPALERLGRRYRLMSLSNGNADLGVIGLAPFFEHSVAAREAGAAKPDRRIFDSLLDRAGLEPGQVAYVGDDPSADVEGARSAGLHAVWMDRFGREWPDGLAPPAYRVCDLAELVALVD